MDLHDPAGCSMEEESHRPSWMGGVSSPSPPYTDPYNSWMLSPGPLYSPPPPTDEDILAGFGAEYFAYQQTTTCSISFQGSPTASDRLWSISNWHVSSPQVTTDPAGCNHAPAAPVAAQGVLTAQRQHQQPVDHDVGGSREKKDPSPLGEEIQAWSPSELFESCEGNIFGRGMSPAPTDAKHAAVAPVVTQGGNPECLQDEMQQQIHTMLLDALTLPSESNIDAGGITVPPREKLLVQTKLGLVQVWGLLPQKNNEELVSLQKMLERLSSAQTSFFKEQYAQFCGDYHCSSSSLSYSHDGFGEEPPEERTETLTILVWHIATEIYVIWAAFKETLCSSSSQAQLIRETVDNTIILANNMGIESENERVDLGNKDVEVEAGDMSRKRTEDAEAKSGLMSRQSTDDRSRKRIKFHSGDISTKGTEDVNAEPGGKCTEDVAVEPGHMSRKRKNCTPRKRSEAWDHFTPVMAEDSRVVNTAKCNYCPEKLKMDKNATTTHLLRHVWDVHDVKLSRSYKFQNRPSKKKKQEDEASTHNQSLDQADAESPGAPHEVPNN